MKKPLHLIMTFFIMLSIGISGSLYLFFDVAQLHFKMEAHEEIAVKDHLQTIKLSLKDFSSQKENDEIWVNGKLYDISSFVVVNDSVIFSVLHDEQEEGLVKNIADSFEPNDKYSSDNIVHVCKHRIHPPGDGKVLVGRYTIGFIEPAQGSHLFSPLNEHCFSPSTAVIKPPPRYRCA